MKDSVRIQDEVKITLIPSKRKEKYNDRTNQAGMDRSTENSERLSRRLPSEELRGALLDSRERPKEGRGCEEG